MIITRTPAPSRATNHGIGEPPPALRIRVAATELNLAEEFVSILCSSAGTLAEDDDTRTIRLEVDQPAARPGEGGTIADGLILLVRHLDDASLREAQAIVAGLPPGYETSLVVATVRESGQSGFKMSCTCGQKLYVGDTSVNKQGRCPACGRAFIVPKESALVQSRLKTDPSVQAVQLIRGHRSLYQSALHTLLERIDARGDALKRQTMRIQLPEDLTDQAI